MTHEEMERTMEFILAQQARFSVDIDLLKESIVEMKIQAELDRQSAKEDRELMKAMFKHLSENADADRRVMREMIQDLKDTIYRVESKADDALWLARKKEDNA
ncbi:MAG TPA: hypothetical protein PLB18_05200 [Acidobacteriota bacterium]|nr:hypothetical protein [Acidobacteriota bacterium]HND18747.1 hypothetical protein [Acidobacteriota bacterium]HNG96364.1 hypothetical protein [Acidobacteriota bacterium]HNJ41476.1 hypothetical protein [Acidobacteriota bacterium]